MIFLYKYLLLMLIFYFIYIILTLGPCDGMVDITDLKSVGL